MKLLFAIISCHKNSERRESQRETWIPRIDGVAEYKFFLGNHPEGKAYEPAADEVILDVRDGYKELPEKVRAVMRWAVERDYEFVLKIDDDVYIYPERVTWNFQQYHYIGHPNGWVAPAHPKGYMSGFAYWVSNRAARAIASAELDPKITHEDRWVGGVLFKSGVIKDGGFKDARYVVLCVFQKPHWRSFAVQGAAFAQFEPAEMKYFHEIAMGRDPVKASQPQPPPPPIVQAGRAVIPTNRIFALGRLRRVR